MATFNKRNSLTALNPALAQEWHPTKNGELTAEHVTPGSGRYVWWKCGRGHEWKAIINSRNRGNKCPYCAGKKACRDNSLETLNPTLAKEWHPTKNRKWTPKDFTPGSGAHVWWKCSRGHEWFVSIANRNRGTGCPYCYRLGLRKVRG